MDHELNPPSSKNPTGSFMKIDAPYDLKSKVGPHKGFSEDVFEKADRALKNLHGTFMVTMKTELDDLKTLHQTYCATPSAALLSTLIDKCHDLKGNGSTFNFHYITTIASLLEDYILTFKEHINKLVIELHINALNRIVLDGVKGDKNPMGDSLVKHLTDLHTAEHHKLKSRGLI